MSKAADGKSGGGAASPYRVLARKYRPQTFEEVVGQEAIVRTLANAITTGRLAHAYIFCGTRGVGKTTMARLLAKALNCETGPTVQPCNSCPPCTEVTAGGAVDVLEIDGASHNKVDDVRDLQESLTYQPVRDRYRVIIIDEVHMLSRSAFNALLKTLEEPPPHVIFVLATTELEKIPSTILSRCQHFTFRRIRRQDLTAHLAHIAEQEKVTVSDTSLDLLARHAAGSLRDALSAFDQIISFCGRDIADDEAEAVLGALPGGRVDDLLRAVASGDAAAALQALRASEDRGEDPPRFAEALLGRLRDLAVLKATGPETDLVEGGPGERAELAELADAFSADALVRFFQMAAQLEPALRHSRQPRALLELTALKMVQAGDLVAVADLAARFAGGSQGSGPARGGPRDAPGDGGRRATPPGAARPAGSAPSASKPVAPSSRPAKAGGAAPAAPRPSPAAGGSTSFDLDRLRQAVERERPAVAAFLEHASGRMEGSVVHLEFRPHHSFFKKSVELPPNRAALENAVEQIFGGGISVSLALVERADSEPSPPPAPAAAAEARRDLYREASGQEAVRSLGDLFGAEIIDVQPLEPGPAAPGTEADR